MERGIARQKSYFPASFEKAFGRVFLSYRRNGEPPLPLPGSSADLETSVPRLRRRLRHHRLSCGLRGNQVFHRDRFAAHEYPAALRSEFDAVPETADPKGSGMCVLWWEVSGVAVLNRTEVRAWFNARARNDVSSTRQRTRRQDTPVLLCVRPFIDANAQNRAIRGSPEITRVSRRRRGF